MEIFPKYVVRKEHDQRGILKGKFAHLQRYSSDLTLCSVSKVSHYQTGFPNISLQMSFAVVTFLPPFFPFSLTNQSFTWQLTVFGKHYFIYNMTYRLLVFQRCEIHLQFLTETRIRRPLC